VSGIDVDRLEMREPGIWRVPVNGGRVT
jgi:hypothetical protein